LIAGKQLTSTGRLPPVLPIVLYNGKPRWTAAEEIAELIETVPGGLERYRPQLRYLLLDERRYQEEELKPLKNLVAVIFRLENSRTPRDLLNIVTMLVEWLQQPEQDNLRRALAIWLMALLKRRIPGLKLPELTELSEVRTMLTERVEDWTKEWWENGLKQGRKEGEFLVLIRQLERKFGPLSEEHRLRLEEADTDTLLEYSDRILIANSIDEVLKW